MIFKLALAGLLVASTGAAQTDSVSKTLLTRRDAKVGAAALLSAAALSYFDPRIASFFADTSLAHVREGQRLDHIFTHINETTLTVGSLAVYGAARLVRSPTVSDIAFHTAEAVAGASLAS